MTVHCQACGHQWEVVLLLPMALDRALIVLTGAAAAGCPTCRADGSVVLGGPPRRAVVTEAHP